MKGCFINDFTNEVTHLVATSVGSPKYRYAIQLGNIQIVTPKWVYECFMHRKILPTINKNEYQVQPFAGLVICATGISKG